MELGLFSHSLLVQQEHGAQPQLLSALNLQPNANIIFPPPLEWRRRKEWGSTRRRVRECDALFWVQTASRPPPALHVAMWMNLRARRSNFILDAWKPLLWKLGLFATIERLDPCFVAYREATTELQRRFPSGKFVWLPHAADTTIFYPRGEEKSVFCFWMGRRYEPLHRALLAYCGARGLRYLYSEGHFYSDEDLGRIASSARYFVVTPSDLDNPRRTGGFSPLVMRYLEGLAAGTRLLGVLPRSGEYEALLPTNAICQVAPDGSNLAERLEEDFSDPNAQGAVDAAGAFVRKYHSWQWRAEQIVDYLANGVAIITPVMQGSPLARASLNRGAADDGEHQ
jgi:Glycosyl transferases group 1